MANNTILFIFAIVNVVVTGLFAGLIFSQFARRRRIYQLFWLIALLMAFLATLSYVFMVIVVPTSGAGVVLFHSYYILGAALAPSWLGLGSIALVTSARVTRISLDILAVLSVIVAVLIAIAPVDMHNLSTIAGTPGTGILRNDATWLPLTITLNTAGVLAVVGVAIYSGVSLWRRQASVAGFHPGNLLWANVLILVGDLLNASAGTFARVFGLASSFWLIMALGWTVFFMGVLLTGRRKTGQAGQKPEVREEGKIKGSTASV